MRVMDLLGRWRLACRVAWLPPPRLADWIYDRIATSRYRLFGRTAQCTVPAHEWKDRIIG